jgi:hypothetical protein
MSTSIAFTDGTGAATLTNGKPVPGDRFASWTPNTDPIGPMDAALGTGITFHWNFRTDYLASFELQHIPNGSLAIAQRLKAWLEKGNTATVNTGDAFASSYTVRIAPGARIELEMMGDRRLLEYTLRLTVKNTAAAPLLCVY